MGHRYHYSLENNGYPRHNSGYYLNSHSHYSQNARHQETYECSYYSEYERAFYFSGFGFLYDCTGIGYLVGNNIALPGVKKLFFAEGNEIAFFSDILFVIGYFIFCNAEYSHIMMQVDKRDDRAVIRFEIFPGISFSLTSGIVKLCRPVHRIHGYL